MKEINFKNSRGLYLAGNLYTAGSKSIIIMIHGFTADKSESGRFDKAAEEFYKQGYNVLRFDLSGSGESDDDSLTVDKEVDDLKCAINYVQDLGLNDIALLGLSLGGLVSAKAYDNRIKTMVLWAPVTDKVKYEWNQRYTRAQLKELSEKGYITKLRDKGPRRKYIIDKQMLKDREDVDQESLLSRIDCPVLIIHGDKDDRVPLDDSKNAIKHLNKDSKLEIIAGADHKFNEQLDQYISHSISWFEKYLPK